MNILLAVIMTWLTANFDLPPALDQPDVKFVSQQQLSAVRYGAMASINASELVAVYDDRTRTIFLTNDWTGGSPAEVSVVVHELVHHLQNAGKLIYNCPGAREELAYAAQEKWLGLFGKSLRSEFEMDRMTLFVRTSCM